MTHNSNRIVLVLGPLLLLAGCADDSCTTNSDCELLCSDGCASPCETAGVTCGEGRTCSAVFRDGTLACLPTCSGAPTPLDPRGVDVGSPLVCVGGATTACENAPGTFCSECGCPEGAFCTAEGCAPQSPDGGACTVDDECAGGLCNSMNQCTTGEPGAACNLGADCTSGLCHPTFLTCEQGILSRCPEGERYCDCAGNLCVPRCSATTESLCPACIGHDGISHCFTSCDDRGSPDNSLCYRNSTCTAVPSPSPTGPRYFCYPDALISLREE